MNKESRQIGSIKKIHLVNGSELEIPLDMVHGMYDVIDMGAKKHGADTYLEPGVFDFNKRGQSMFRHEMKMYGIYQIYLKVQDVLNRNVQMDLDLEEFAIYQAYKIILGEIGNAEYKESNQYDDESGLLHAAHLQCNAGMAYTNIKIGNWKEE